MDPCSGLAWGRWNDATDRSWASSPWETPVNDDVYIRNCKHAASHLSMPAESEEFFTLHCAIRALLRQ
jgi:hypothetical protein